MSDKHQDHVVRIAQLLSDAQGRETIALDVSGTCGFSDYFVITTVNSQGHLRGLIVQLDELFRELDLRPFHPRKRDTEIGWVLIDLGFAVIHLMTEELREFYELERLWFGSETLYSSSSSSDRSSGSSTSSS
ncbi:MAG: ribosome silencing factor [Spirochaetota bacterium]